jgi:hypothetical protein
LVFKKASVDAYSQGKTLTTNSVANVVVNAFNKALLPKDPNGIYLVLSSRYILTQPHLSDEILRKSIKI